MMSNDFAFETTAGPEASGTRYAGRGRVRETFAGVFNEGRFGLDAVAHIAVLLYRAWFLSGLAPRLRLSAGSEPVGATRLTQRQHYLPPPDSARQ
jgi:hypothetical protein